MKAKSKGGGFWSLTLPMLALSLTVSLFSADQARANTILKIWNGQSSTSSNWSDGDNWEDNQPPTGGDQRIIFRPGMLRVTNENDLPAGTPFESIWFDSGGYTVNGNAIATESIHMDANAGHSTLNLPVQATDNLSIMIQDGASSLTIGNEIALGGYTLNLYASGDVIISGWITGSGEVIKRYGGEATFQGMMANTYTGKTSVLGGVLRLKKRFYFPPSVDIDQISIPGELSIGELSSTLIGDVVILERSGQIAETARVSVYSTGQFDLGGHENTIDDLYVKGGNVMTRAAGLLGVNDMLWCYPAAKDSVISGNLHLGTGTRTVHVDGAAELDLQADISADRGASILKTGTGVLSLSGMNSYLGATVVSLGSLMVNGRQADGSRVLMGSDTLLGGNGSLAEAELFAGADIRPGASPGQLTFREELDAVEADMHFEIDGPAPGNGYDQLMVDGTASLGDSELHLDFGYMPPPTTAFTLIENSGASPVTGTFSSLPEGAFFARNTMVFQITYTGGTGNDVVITRTAPPPPTLLSINASAWGDVTIQGAGTWGVSYQVQRASHLPDWSLLGYTTAGTNGVFTIVDPTAGTLPTRCYRALSP